jgi:hypothetical protein
MGGAVRWRDGRGDVPHCVTITAYWVADRGNVGQEKAIQPPCNTGCQYAWVRFENFRVVAE